MLFSKNGSAQLNRADLPAGAARQVAEAFGSGAGCKAGVGRFAGADGGELGAGKVDMKVRSTY